MSQNVTPRLGTTLVTIHLGHIVMEYNTIQNYKTKNTVDKLSYTVLSPFQIIRGTAR